MELFRNFLLLIYTLISILIKQRDAKNYHFTYATVPSVPLEEEFVSELQELVPFNTEQERRQLCHYAKVEANIPYLDFSYIPKWQKYKNDLSPSSRPALHQYGMYCATLPTIYILTNASSPRDYLQITQLATDILRFGIDRPIDAKFVLISRSQEYEESKLAKLSPEDRRHLCNLAQYSVPTAFMNKDVDEGRNYDFVYNDTMNTHFAIQCPTLLPLYVTHDSSTNLVKIIVGPSIIKEFSRFTIGDSALLVSFLDRGIVDNELTTLDHEDRATLCISAREYIGALPHNEMNTTSVGRYAFLHEGGNRKKDLAVFCPTAPPMYLRLSLDRKIEIQLFRNLYELSPYHYTMEFVNSISPTESVNDDKSLKNKDNDVWNLCAAALKRIPEIRVFPSPSYISWQMYKLFSRKNDDGEFLDPGPAVAAIKCSAIPPIFIRYGKSSEEIIITRVKDEGDTVTINHRKWPF